MRGQFGKSARLTHATFQPKLVVPAVAAALAAAFFTASLAGVRESTVQSIMQIEQVENRLVATPKLVEGVAQAAKADGLKSVSELQPILQQAANQAFSAEPIETSLRKALSGAAGTDIDPSALAKASRALAVAEQEIADEAASANAEPSDPQRRTHLIDPKDHARIAALVEVMASPELAAETALTQQVMYIALEALTNSTASQITAMPAQDISEQMKGLVGKLRERRVNEKPVPRDVVEALEKNRLAMSLASLSPENLQILSHFYDSEGGKRKRDILVSSYRDASDAANARLLTTYFRLLAEHLKSNSSQ